MILRHVSLSFVIGLSLAAVARAELAPNQIGIIAMAESADSQELAKHYAKVRGVPEANILLLEGKPSQTLSRHLWETKTRPAVRQWLFEDDRASTIRCFVTCQDVPLKIGRRDAGSPEIVERKDFLGRVRENQVKQVDRLVSMLESLGSGAEPKPGDPTAANAPLQELAKRLEAAMGAAQGQFMAIPDNAKREEAGRALEQGLVRIGGGSQMLRVAAQARRQMQPEQAMQMEILNARMQGLQQGIAALGSLPPSVPRDAQLINLIQMHDGLLGAIGFVDQELQALEKNETYSSFDGELSLIRQNDYPLDRWQPNLLYHGFGGRAGGEQSVVMVARLAAPTLALAKGLVDKAVATEAKGLSGKVYLDARGMTLEAEKTQPGSYESYDQSIRDLAERLKKHTALEVVLNDKPELFQPGECPDAALYCGWYSLAKYVDAFEWRPGAIGYHLASSEAATLQKPDATVWCSAMIEDGVTATLGPVYEPYLFSFPEPDEFFSLLLTGKHTLVEVYYRTQPFNSWVMVLVGDPLYNPFKNSPALEEANLPDSLKPETSIPTR